MVICIVALAVFAVLGIFSVHYRKLAKEALTCVKNMLLFQPCVTKLDEKIKSKVTIKLMKTPALARFFYKNFKLLSWIFTITFFASMIYSVYGIYNLVVFGSCQPGSVCVINQGANQIVRLLTCYEAQIVYGIMVFAVIILLCIRYLNIKFKKK
jgi:hypothetical protein